MIRALVVLLVCLVGCSPSYGRPVIEDPSQPEGLNPIETLVNPPLHIFKQMKGTGYESQSFEYDEEDDTEYVETEYRKEQSTLIAKYLQYLEEVKSKREEPNVRNALDIIKMLVTHSWLSNFSPDKNLMKEVLPPTVDLNSPRKKIRNDLAEELKLRNRRTPVSDAILLYSNGLFQSIKNDLEANVKAYSNMIVDKNILLDMDYKTKTKVTRDNEAYDMLLDKNKLLLEIHKVAFKMAVQSYLKIFVSNPLDGKKTFVLKSYDGLQQKEFPVPPMAPESFEWLVLEAEMENESTKSDERKSIEELRKKQNTMISQYLQNLEIIRKTSMSSFEDSNALRVIKLLLIQSWIHMLFPEMKYIAEVYPVEEYSTVAGVKENIIMELKKTIAYPEIVESLIRYSNHLQPELRTILQNQVRDMFPKIEKNLQTISLLGSGLLKDKEVLLRDENVMRLANLKMMTQFHEITMKMCTQSYVLDFLKQPYPNPVTLTSTMGEKLKVDLPPTDKDSYEDLAYFIP